MAEEQKREKRYSFLLVFYNQKLDDGRLTDSVEIVLAADALDEAVINAKTILGTRLIIDRPNWYLKSVVEFTAYLR